MRNSSERTPLLHVQTSNSRSFLYDVASMYVKEGMGGRTIEPGWNESRLQTQIKAFKWLQLPYWNQVFMLCGFVHMSLLFFLHIASVRAVVHSIELFCVLVFVVDLVLYMNFVTWSKGLRKPWNISRCLVIFLIALDLLLRTIVPEFMAFARPLRPLVILFRRHTFRTMVTGCIKTLRHVFVVFIIMLFHIFFYGFLAFLLFSQPPNTVEDIHKPGESWAIPMHFNTLREAVYNMVIIHTSIVQLSAGLLGGHERGLLGVANDMFFLSFVFIGNLFFIRTIVAIAYRTFKAHFEVTSQRHAERRNHALGIVYTLLNQNGFIPLEVWNELYVRLRRGATARQGAYVYQMFADPSKPPSYVTLTQFMHMCSVSDFTVPESRGSVRDAMGVLFRKGFLLKCKRRSPIKVTYSGITLHILIAFSGFQLYKETSALLQCVGGETCADLWIWSQIGVFLLCIFLTESLCKMMSLGWRLYWEDPWNRIDVIANCAAPLIFISASHLPPEMQFNRVSKLVAALRLLRLLQLLSWTDRYQRLAFALTNGSGTLIRLVYFFISLLYIFAALGNQMFEFWLDATDPRLANMAWASVGDIYTFDDFISSFTCVYLIAFVNNWTVVMNATVAAMGPGYVIRTYAFFFGCRVAMELVFVPVIFGAVIETLANQFQAYEIEQQSKKNGGKTSDNSIDLVTIDPSVRSQLSSVDVFRLRA